MHVEIIIHALMFLNPSDVIYIMNYIIFFDSVVDLMINAIIFFIVLHLNICRNCIELK